MRDRYFDAGKVGWLWLTYGERGKAALAKMSDLRLGESGFDTMLLYSDKGTTESGGFVEMSFAISSAGSVAEAERIYNDLGVKGLVRPTPKLREEESK